MSVIFAFSQHHNIETGVSTDFLLKKTAHLGEYGILGLSFFFAFAAGRLPFRRCLEKAWAWSVLYAVTDEFHQWFVPTRSATPRDVCLDALGAFLALGLLWILRKPRSITLP
jgi:VanZ family protein